LSRKSAAPSLTILLHMLAFGKRRRVEPGGVAGKTWTAVRAQTVASAWMRKEGTPWKQGTQLMAAYADQVHPQFVMERSSPSLCADHDGHLRSCWDERQILVPEPHCCKQRREECIRKGKPPCGLSRMHAIARLKPYQDVTLVAAPKATDKTWALKYCVVRDELLGVVHIEVQTATGALCCGWILHGKSMQREKWGGAAEMRSMVEALPAAGVEHSEMELTEVWDNWRSSAFFHSGELVTIMRVDDHTVDLKYNIFYVPTQVHVRATNLQGVWPDDVCVVFKFGGVRGPSRCGLICL